MFEALDYFQNSLIGVATGATISSQLAGNPESEPSTLFPVADSVLTFWFHGDLHTNYKTKWFPDGSADIQHKADETVNTLFGVVFNDAINGDLAQWKADNSATVALIIVLDQFSRHIYRLRGLASDHCDRKAADTLALAVAEELTSRPGWDDELSVPEFVFSLMPFRHSATIERLQGVMASIARRQSSESEAMDLLHKFSKQTIRRLQHLQDISRAHEDDEILEFLPFQADESDIMSNKLVSSTEQFLLKYMGNGRTTDKKVDIGSNSTNNSASRRSEQGVNKNYTTAYSSAKSDEDKDCATNTIIKTTAPAIAGITDADTDADGVDNGPTVAATTAQRTSTSSSSMDKGQRKAEADASEAGEKEEIAGCGDDDTEGSPPEAVVISLSGGVDSMVIAKILVLLRRSGSSVQTGRPGSVQSGGRSGSVRIGRIVAIHIDYGNRDESAREAAFVKQWCEEQGLEFRLRVVSEVRRGVTGRDEYERVSRDLRYATYRAVLRDFGCGGGVIFGHHMGDVQENVISNVMRGCSPLALSGMSEAGVTNGVEVWRPLLAHTKEEIFEFAHKYGVPYFKDTTPTWSTRGKLRRQLLPLLIDMYGEGCIRNLSALAAESDEMAELVQRNVYAPFLRSVRKYPCGLSVNVLPYAEQPLCFWREMLKELMHSMGMSMVRERSVASFLERLTLALQKHKHRHRQEHKGQQTQQQRQGQGQQGQDWSNITLKAGWIELRKGFHTMLCENGDLVILRDGVLPLSPGSNNDAHVLSPGSSSDTHVLSPGSSSDTHALSPGSNSEGGHKHVSGSSSVSPGTELGTSTTTSHSDGTVVSELENKAVNEVEKGVERKVVVMGCKGEGLFVPFSSLLTSTATTATHAAPAAAISGNSSSSSDKAKETAMASTGNEKASHTYHDEFRKEKEENGEEEGGVVLGTLVVDTWEITIVRLLPVITTGSQDGAITVTGRDRELSRLRSLQSVRDILEGHFNYVVNIVPTHTQGFMLWADAARLTKNKTKAKATMNAARTDAHTPAASSNSSSSSTTAGEQGSGGRGGKSGEDRDKNEKKQEKNEIIPNTAEYPKEARSTQLQHQYQLQCQQSSVKADDLVAVEVAAFNGADSRLRAGLPLLVPVAMREAALQAETEIGEAEAIVSRGGEGSGVGVYAAVPVSPLVPTDTAAARMPVVKGPLWLRLEYRYIGPHAITFPPYANEDDRNYCNNY